MFPIYFALLNKCHESTNVKPTSQMKLNSNAFKNSMGFPLLHDVPNFLLYDVH